MEAAHDLVRQSNHLVTTAAELLRVEMTVDERLEADVTGMNQAFSGWSNG